MPEPKGISPDAVRRMAAQGLSQSQIGERLGLTGSGVHHIMKRHGITPSRRVVAKIDPKRLVALREQGLTNAEIAAAFDCSAAAVSAHVKRLGLPQRTTGNRPRASDDQLRAAVAEGLSAPAIAERFGMSRRVVYTRLAALELSAAPARPSADAGELARMLAEGVGLDDAAAHFGVQRGSLLDFMRRNGIDVPDGEKRTSAAQRKSKPKPPARLPRLRAPRADEIARPVPGVIRRPAMPAGAAPHPVFDAVIDGRILATKGRHVEIAELAAALKMPIQRVTARWHVLRAAA